MNESDKPKLKTISKLVAGHVANIFTYFLGLYFFIFLMSFFFDLWQEFWMRPMLHISLVIFGLIYLIEKGVHKIKLSDWRALLKNANVFFSQVGKNLLVKIKTGGLTIFFGFWSVFFLLFCPLLSYLKSDALSEKAAIYAFYSLATTLALIVVDGVVEGYRSRNH